MAAPGFTVSAESTQAFQQAINRLRRSYGLRALNASPQLRQAAAAHARALANAGQFTHDWGDAPFTTWIRRYYPPLPGHFWHVAENLFWSAATVTPSSALNTWLGSPAHRRALLLPNWRDLGLAIVTAIAAPGTYRGLKVTIVAAEFGHRDN
jgi:uncharacterized protein YkwD